MTSIAFLGTGLLGAALAEAAARRGDRVTAWNRTAAKAQALTAFGVQVAATPADAVREATVVHLVLTDDAVVEEVVAALRPGLRPDAIIVDHTTAQPVLTAERARRLTGEGVRYLHCPVFIGPAAARQAQGTILAAGPRALFDAVEPHFRTMAARVQYVGERADLAAVHKLCGNAFLIGVVGVLADTMAIATQAGVPASDALEVTQIFDLKALVAGRGRTMLARDHAASFELAMARKDVRLMLETAGGTPLSVLPAVAARMDALIAEGLGAADFSVISRDSVG